MQSYLAAVAIELMNEPPSIERDAMYATWQAASEFQERMLLSLICVVKACYTEARAAVPDIAVGVMDPGESPLIPLSG